MSTTGQRGQETAHHGHHRSGYGQHHARGGKMHSEQAMSSEEVPLILHLVTVIRDHRAYNTLVYARDAVHARDLTASWIRQQQCHDPAAAQVQAYPHGFSMGRTSFTGTIEGSRTDEQE